jgi:hypothetical protein
MAAQFQTQKNPTRAQAGSPVFRTSGIVQRKCACGGSPGVSGECADCQENSLQRITLNSTKATDVPSIVQQSRFSPGEPFDAGTRRFTEARFGHDFSRVQIHSYVRAGHVLPTQSKSIAAPVPISAPGGLREVFINGPGDRPTQAPSSPAPAKKDPTPPARTGANCPTDIQVAAVSPANDVDFGKDGFLTGWGGISIMEVSDPSGKTWDGTAIHENLSNIKNTCGNRGKPICSNESGQRGGTAGSTFKMGEESNFLGKAKLPATKNKFYDLHVMSTKEASLLHELKKDSCEVQCGQSYDCGGKRFGPDFIISYTMTRDVVKSGARNIDVTRVAMKKAAVVKQAGSGGDKP